jgi:adenosylhomocysteine nucleosidase
MTFCDAPAPAGELEDDAATPAIAVPSAQRLVIALVGMVFEARIAAGPCVFVICRNTQGEIAASLERALQRGCRSIISFGVAGGLAPHLRAGDWVVASSIIDARQDRPTDVTWSQKLARLIPGAHHAPIAGVDAALTDAAAKRQMHAETGAAAVDMESHLVARLAEAHGLSFTAARVIIDPAHRFVPAAALAALRPDGSASIAAVLRELAAAPSQLLALLRLASDGYVARGALTRMRRALGPSFGL